MVVRYGESCNSISSIIILHVKICCERGKASHHVNHVTYLQSDIDAKVLVAQHYKLSECFRHKERQRVQLQQRVEQLESRQARDGAALCTINRFWDRVRLSCLFVFMRFFS